ncbi:hypothetical protein BGY98DRAFT_1007034 [Russula aff. rugulosa BPL654]|nr:hypothetical protein BGY98DRAFT_1007034 [Russula aff. rugulosa BPL654]
MYGKPAIVTVVYVFPLADPTKPYPTRDERGPNFDRQHVPPSDTKRSNKICEGGSRPPVLEHVL